MKIVKKGYCSVLKVSILLFVIATSFFVNGKVVAQSLTHPHVLIKNDEKADILAKIDEYQWAEDLFNQYKSRVDSKKNSHKSNPAIILNAIPDFPGDKSKHTEYLTLGYESALLYWLTGNNDYGQLAADILAYYTKSISNISGDLHFFTGPSYAHLIETREHYTKPPIIYDFVHAFLKKSETKVYDVDSGNRVAFNFSNAEKTFIKLADGVFNEGSINSNHPILEAPGALFNLLVIEDDTKRATYFNKFMDGTPKQNGLTWMMNTCKASSVWPEATGYSIGPHRIILELMNVVDRYKPSLNVIGKNKDLIKNAFFFENYRFPNNQNVMRFGDAHRNSLNTKLIFERVLVMSDRMEYGTLKKDALDALKAIYKESGGYKPKVSTQSLEWNNPYYLLWNLDIPSTNVTPIEYNTSINIDYAGIAMQRNINTGDRVENGMMAYIGGAHYVHSHLTGIDLEIYGLGAVLGTGGGDVGASRRNEDEFRNYHRIYAGHNTVIVNGKSKGKGPGSWKGDNQLNQSKVNTVGAEPLSLAPAISEEFSFSSQELNDAVNDAKQQRVLSVIRTGDETGYYFDLFRSKSNGTNNYHDYVYHNVGDGVNLKDAQGVDLPVTTKTNRYQSTQSSYANNFVMFPGWHYFEEVQTSNKTTKGIKATIPMTKEGTRYMHVLMPGGENREYTKCKGPATIEAQVGYEDEKTPIVTVRHYGEAWSKPFINIFEASRKQNGSVQSVENLYDGAKIVGARVTSIVNGKSIVDYVISNINANDTYTSTSPAITFKGRFAIVRVRDESTTLYIGEGESLVYEGQTLTAIDKKGLKTVNNQTEPNQAPISTFDNPVVNTINEGYTELYVKVSATDPDGDDSKLSTVLKIDGVEIRKEGVAPYEWGIAGNVNASETVGLTIGDHVLEVVVTDEAGEKTTISKTITVLRVNLAPVIEIISPANNAVFYVGDEITITADATDDVLVDKVNFKVNNVFYSQDSEAEGIEYSTLFTPEEAGVYVLGARAFDDEGESTEVTVSVEVKDPVITSSKEVEGDVFSVYPNPTNGLVHLNKSAKWEVYTPQGIKVSEGLGLEIDLSDYSKGVYLLKAGDESISVFLR